MSNKGVLSGVTPGVWQRYKPRMKCVGGTDPVLDDTGAIQIITGQWLYQPNGTILAMVQVEFLGSNFSIGSGGPYAFSLPYPAHRAAALPDGTCPVPLGDLGMCYFSFAAPAGLPNVNIEVVPTLANPHASLDDADYWFQAYAPFILDWGTFTAVAADGGATVVNHKAGFAFDPSDFSYVTTSSNAQGTANCWLTSITSTQFTFNTRAALGAGTTLDVAYKIRAEPPSGATGALISPTVPLAWSRVTNLGPFGNFFFQLEYRPRR